nr:unnamed protein product [Callosobruchus analis]
MNNFKHTKVIAGLIALSGTKLLPILEESTPFISDIIRQFKDYETYIMFDNYTTRPMSVNYPGESRNVTIFINTDVNSSVKCHYGSSQRLYLFFSVPRKTQRSCFSNRDVIILISTRNRLLGCSNILPIRCDVSLVLLIRRQGSVYHCSCFNSKKKTESYRLSSGKLLHLEGMKNGFVDLEGGNTKDVAGTEFNLLKVLSKKLNFTYNLRKFSHAGSWSSKAHIISAIRNGNIDFGMGGTTITYDRYRYVSTPSITQYDFYLAVFAKKHYFIRDRISLVHQILLKNYFILFVFLSNMALVILYKVSIKIHKGKGDIRSFLWVLLSSYLVMPLYENWNGVDDLLDNDFAFATSQDDYSYLQRSCTRLTRFCTEFPKRATPVSDICKPFKSFRDYKVAMVIERTSFMYLVKSNRCELSLNFLMYVTYFPLDVGAGYQSPMYRKNSPYIEQFSSVIQRIVESGISQHWMKSVQQQKDIFDVDLVWFISHPRSLSDFRSTLCLLIVGHIFSVFIFICEMITVKTAFNWPVFFRAGNKKINC